METAYKVFVIFLVVAAFVIANLAYAIATIEYTTIEGKVVDVVALDDYFTITLDNGEIYNINYPYGEKDIDLTVNSKLIFKLAYNDIWFSPNTNNCWDIKRMLKVPSDGD